MAAAPESHFKKTEFESDTRNVADLWSEAIRTYNKSAEVPLVIGRFSDTHAMIKFGTQEMNQFHSWRHDDKKVDKLRKLFIGNIGFIEAGMKQIISAVSTSFPPAVAIGTAVTLVLSAAKSVSADYDVIINFFEDMNNFLQRVSIVATRVPTKQAYQNALLDVFSTFLVMIGLAHKTISLGRFKKWAINAVFGGDSDLSGGRKKMDVSLARLQSATEFAILDNSENMLEKQQDLEATLAEYHQELLQNQRVQQRLASSQSLALQNISDTLQECKDDIKKLLEFAQRQREDSKQPTLKGSEERSERDNKAEKHSANRVRAQMPNIPDISSLIRELEKAQVEGMGAWIFENPLWLKWINEESNISSIITIDGPPGIGKSFVSVTVYRHLQQLFQQNSDHPSCAAYFTFRRDQQHFNTMCQALYSMAVQLADQYPKILHCLEAKIEDEATFYSFRKYDEDDAVAWWDFFICDIFTVDFDYQLYLVFDGLDELSSDEERQIFCDLIAKIQQRNLKVKVVVTDKSQMQEGAIDHAQVIHMDRKLISADLRKLIWDRLHNSDSAYEGLRKLRKSTKQKLARKVDQHADGLLYAEQMLRYLSGIARESAINKILDESLPSDLIGLYEMVLDRVKRRLDAISLPVMRNIVVWATFALRWLSLAELNALGRLLFPKEAEIVEEKLLDEFAPFFEMSYLSTDVSETDVSVHPTVLFSDESVPHTEGDQIDSQIRVKLRERTMKTFFGADSNSQNEFTMTPSRANALIFLTSTRMIIDSEPGATLDSATKSILDYAVGNCFKHWTRIDSWEHTDEECIEICSTFVELITSHTFAKAILQLPNELGILGLVGPDDDGKFSGMKFYEQWKIWSDIACHLPLKQEISTYWSKGSEDAVWPLARSYIAKWLNSSNALTASKAYRFAADAVAKTRNKGILDTIFNEDAASNSTDLHGETHIKGIEELVKVVRICEIDLDQKVHYPYAIVLSNKSKYAASTMVYKEILQYSSAKIQIARCQLNMGINYQSLADWSQAVHWIDEALRTTTNLLGVSLDGIESSDSRAQNTNHETRVVVEADREQVQLTATDKEDMRRVLGNALIVKSKIKHSLKQPGEAATLLRQSRLCRPDIVPADTLLTELEYLWEAGHRYADIMDTLKDFKAIERLNLMTSTALSAQMQLRRDRLLLLASARSQRSEVLLKLYEEVITILDAEQAGAPMRVSLALAKRMLQQDNSGAKALLDQVLDSVTEQSVYKLTEEDPGWVALIATYSLSDILLEDFRDKTKGVEKYQLLLDVKGLPERSLASTTTIMRSSWSPSQLILARMLQKLGPASEYERVMNKSFEVTMASLTDATSENDQENIDALARLLSLMPATRTFSKMIFSCRFYAIDAKEDETQNEERVISCEKVEEEYDIDTGEEGFTFCDGVCFPETTFKHWDKDNPFYGCLVCADSYLCKSCYEIRMQWNRDPSSKPDTEPNFCCSNGLYITGPIEGWRGVKNGVIYLDSDVTETASSGEPANGSSTAVKGIPFKDLLEDIKVAWKKAWEDYWTGI